MRYGTLDQMLRSELAPNDGYAVLAEHPNPAYFPSPNEGYSYLRCGSPIEVVRRWEVNDMVLCIDIAGQGCRPGLFILVPKTTMVLY